jgi:hypothetical protein
MYNVSLDWGPVPNWSRTVTKFCVSQKQQTALSMITQLNMDRRMWYLNTGQLRSIIMINGLYVAVNDDCYSHYTENQTSVASIPPPFH